jgi:hypothetical protein
MNDGLIINAAKVKIWYKNGLRHRLGGPAVMLPDGSTLWYKEDKLHREGGPAIEYANGSKEWYKEGKIHREDGPACEYANGYKEWWYEDKRLFCETQEEFLRLIKLKVLW